MLLSPKTESVEFDAVIDEIRRWSSLSEVYYNRIKKGEGQGKYVTFSTMIHKEAGERLEMTTHHVPFRQMID